MKYIFLLFSIAIILSCDNSRPNNNNPNLPSYSFSVDINLDLPLYLSLKYAGNGIYYPNVGVRGIFIFNTGSGYNAFDAACPNQTLSNCSTMNLDGINAICPCDNSSYNLYTGQGGLQYPLKQYRVEVNGVFLRVYN